MSKDKCIIDTKESTYKEGSKFLLTHYSYLNTITERLNTQKDGNKRKTCLILPTMEYENYKFRFNMKSSCPSDFNFGVYWVYDDTEMTHLYKNPKEMELYHLVVIRFRSRLLRPRRLRYFRAFLHKYFYRIACPINLHKYIPKVPYTWYISNEILFMTKAPKYQLQLYSSILGVETDKDFFTKSMASFTISVLLEHKIQINGITSTIPYPHKKSFYWLNTNYKNTIMK